MTFLKQLREYNRDAFWNQIVDLMFVEKERTYFE